MTFPLNVVDYLLAAGVCAVAFFVALIVKRVVARRLAVWAERSATEIDDVVVGSLQRPIPWWGLLIGLYLAMRIVPLSRHVMAIGGKILVAVLILSVTVWLADLCVRLLVASRFVRGEEGREPPGVARNIVRVGIYITGILVMLSTLGISIAPLLTTLGIGGLAVALGLQDTLANLFAGIHITLARDIRPGHFIKLETGDEGYVDDIGWRSTRVHLLPNNIVLIPNSKLAQSIVTNYDLPNREASVRVQVGVHYGSDLEHVERVTCEVGKAVMQEVTGGLPEFDPFIRYHTFNNSSIDFTVILRGTQYTDGYLLKHEFIKRLHARFAQENIVIPYPIRALNLDQEGADKQLGLSRSMPD